MEIERKFLVVGAPWRDAERSSALRQGYLSSGGPLSVRVRLSADSAWLTLKGPTTNWSREEFEYAIPVPDAEAMLAFCGELVVEKVRHELRVGDHVWEIDVFGGRNAGLVMAEIELTREDETFQRPDWLGVEVSHDPRYRNSALAERPYSSWVD
jgi:adenylate cyclase